MGRRPTRERKVINQIEIREMSRPLGVARIAREIRRQESNSDFNGFTVNYSVSSLQEFLRSADGPKWVLSVVPLRMVKCLQTRLPVEDFLDTAESVAQRRLLTRQVRQMALEVRLGRSLPGIFLTRSQSRRDEHWILEGYRRVFAHRVAGARTILVYRPVDLFGDPRKSGDPSAQAD